MENLLNPAIPFYNSVYFRDLHANGISMTGPVVPNEVLYVGATGYISAAPSLNYNPSTQAVTTLNNTLEDGSGDIKISGTSTLNQPILLPIISSVVPGGLKVNGSFPTATGATTATLNSRVGSVTFSPGVSLVAQATTTLSISNSLCTSNGQVLAWMSGIGGQNANSLPALQYCNISGTTIQLFVTNYATTTATGTSYDVVINFMLLN